MKAFQKEGKRNREGGGAVGKGKGGNMKKEGGDLRRRRKGAKRNLRIQDCVKERTPLLLRSIGEKEAIQGRLRASRNRESRKAGGVSEGKGGKQGNQYKKRFS